MFCLLAAIDRWMNGWMIDLNRDDPIYASCMLVTLPPIVFFDIHIHIL